MRALGPCRAQGVAVVGAVDKEGCARPPGRASAKPPEDAAQNLSVIGARHSARLRRSSGWARPVAGK